MAGTDASQVLRDAAIPIATTAATRAAVVDDAGVVRTPFGAEYTPRHRALLEQRLVNLRSLWDDGVVLAFGTDLPYGPRESLDLEVRILSEIFSPEEIVQALTRNAARYLDLESEIGTLEAGKVADILIVDGNPLVDISSLANVQVVLQGGVVVVDNR